MFRSYENYNPGVQQIADAVMEKAKSNKALKRTISAIGATAFMSLVTSAHAAIDVADALSGIGEAQTAILSVVGALLAMSVAIFGIAKVYAFIKRRAGA